MADEGDAVPPSPWAEPGVPRPAAPPKASAAHLVVAAAVDALLAGPLSGRPVDAATTLALAERLRGQALAELGELDAAGLATCDGSPSAAVWLRREQTIRDDTARATITLARRLREDLTGLGVLLRSGGTTVEHVRAVAAGTTGLDPALVGEAAAALVDLVEATEPARVRRELRERAHAIDPDLARDAARRARARQAFYADPTDTGVHLGGSLSPEDGAVLLHGLDLHVQADRTLGGAAGGDGRSLPARRAAALVDWAREAALRLTGPGDTHAQDAHTARSHLLITCTPDQLSVLADHSAGRALLGRLAGPQALAVLTGSEPVEPGRLPTGQTLLPEALRRTLCDTTLSLVLADHADSDHTGSDHTGTALQPRSPAAGSWRWAPLFVGRSSRTVTGAQFKALVVRDRHCVVAGCHRRPAQCEAHHVQHWLDGGSTDLDNLVLLCHLHHHDHHDRGHDLQTHDGRWITRTGWADDPPGPATPAAA